MTLLRPGIPCNSWRLPVQMSSDSSDVSATHRTVKIPAGGDCTVMQVCTLLAVPGLSLLSRSRACGVPAVCHLLPRAWGGAWFKPQAELGAWKKRVVGCRGQSDRLSAEGLVDLGATERGALPRAVHLARGRLFFLVLLVVMCLLAWWAIASFAGWLLPILLLLSGRLGETLGAHRLLCPYVLGFTKPEQVLKASHLLFQLLQKVFLLDTPLRHRIKPLQTFWEFCPKHMYSGGQIRVRAASISEAPRATWLSC